MKTMKTCILAAAALLISSSAYAQGAAARKVELIPEKGPVTFIPHEKVQAALDGKAGLHLLDAPDLSVEGCFRDRPGNVEVHTELTNVFYITNGEATMVIGGTNKDGKEVSKGQIRGGTIVGGTEYHVVKGDVFVIRPGIPTWFKEVPKTVSYYVVKHINHS